MQCSPLLVRLSDLMEASTVKQGVGTEQNSIAMSILTHSCLEIYLTSVVWTCHTFENNFGVQYKFAKYLKEGCR